tara:strand:- start:1257 stop:1559 length:303 start_codon:yes stop_codon:yes gene_type:complete
MKIKQRIRPDFSAPHVRKQVWQMKLLKFYRTIEYDDDIYHEFATKVLSNKLDKKQLEQVNQLMRIDEENKKKKWEKIRQKRATELGVSVRKIFHKTKIKN